MYHIELYDDHQVVWDVEDTNPDLEDFYKEHLCNFVEGPREVKAELIPTKATEVDKGAVLPGYIHKAGTAEQQAARYAEQCMSMQKGYDELVIALTHAQRRNEELEKQVDKWSARAVGRLKSIEALKKQLDLALGVAHEDV